MTDSPGQPRRLTFKENVVMRLIGLFIFVAPTAGTKFLAGVTEDVMEKIGV
jgi:hypothetical protein